MPPTHDWRRLAEQFLDTHGIRSMGEIEARIGPLEGLASPEALRAFQACAEPDAAELSLLLRDRRLRLFVKLLMFATETVPAPIFPDAVRAAVDTDDPSFNQQFAWACTIVHGRRPVFDELLKICESGSNREKYGVAGVVYWCAIPREHIRWPHLRYTSRQLPPDEPIDDLLARFEDWAVAEFVRNPDLDVRRSLVHYITRGKERHPDLTDAAIASAREHEDDYVRHRIRADLGESLQLPCKPMLSRGPEDAG
ncbi:hypothetical protein WMF20_36625 [Sorangium sp. So ce834]|uniref:hypothetical protein n=1 Tax=Sorangium sp. So ce834 TaxID=3133321 RepID=UPI003F5EF075